MNLNPLSIAQDSKKQTTTTSNPYAMFDNEDDQ